MPEQGIHRLARSVDHVQDPFGEAGLEKQLGQALTAERGALGRLEDEGVPRHHRQRKHPQRDHHREVERGDSGADTKRVAVEVLVDPGGDVAQGSSLEQGWRAAREVDHLDAARLFQRLAVVPGDDRRELLEVLLEEGLVAKHQSHPLHHGGLRPFGVSPGCGRDRRVHVSVAGQRHLLDDLAGRRVEDG